MILDLSYPVSYQIWFLRSRIFPAYAVLVLLRSIWMYTDQTKILLANNAMLQDMVQNQDQMMEMMKVLTTQVLCTELILYLQAIIENQNIANVVEGDSKSRGLWRMSPFSSKSPKKDGHVIVVRE